VSREFLRELLGAVFGLDEDDDRGFDAVGDELSKRE